MNARERVQRCLTFKTPDRVPRDLWALTAVHMFRKGEYDTIVKKYPLDIIPAFLDPEAMKKRASTRQVGSYKDEWGSTWHVAQAGLAGEVKEPVLADWAGLDKFQPPWDIIKERDFSFANRTCDQAKTFMISETTARPFERMQFLRGTEQVMMDMAYGTAEFRRLLGMVHEYYLRDVESWCGSAVDAISLMDDWGSNLALLIAPAMWREIFKPLYREYCQLIHRAGKFVFMHSDGNIAAIYPDLIEVGVDAINSQLFCMDIEEIARNYKGKITFWGEIDRQHILPFGTPEQVREAVERIRRNFDDGQGGVIAQCEWGVNDPIANIEAVYQNWLR